VRHRRYRGRIAATIGASLGAFVLCVLGSSLQADAGEPVPPYYVVVGASESVGWQPSSTHPYGQRSATGYANDLLQNERVRWNDLQLVAFGCPGDTTARAIVGGDRCHPTIGSQLSDVLTFLHQHPTTVLTTVDLGYNNLLPCLRHQTVDEPCVSQALDQVSQQLLRIVLALRAAGGANMQLIGVGHNDPFLGYYLHGPSGQDFALETLSVFSRLNDTLRSVYAEAGVPMADVASAYSTNDMTPVPYGALGSVPKDVARICSLTWMCEPPPLRPNIHPNDAGYEVISDAIRSVMDNS